MSNVFSFINPLTIPLYFSIKKVVLNKNENVNILKIWNTFNSNHKESKGVLLKKILLFIQNSCLVTLIQLKETRILS